MKSSELKNAMLGGLFGGALGLGGVCVLQMITAMAVTWHQEQMHPSGEAAYLGDGCVVNIVETEEQFEELLGWCLFQYKLEHEESK